MENSLPKFTSVIIPTYNRAESLRRVLGTLAAQTSVPNPFEVVVVDDGSEDHTREVCEAMAESLPRFKYIALGRNTGIANARNQGIKHSTGDYVLFLDDDCLAHSNWIACLQNVLERTPVAAGAIQSPEDNFVKLTHNISQCHPVLAGRRSRQVMFFAGANMGFRRFVLEELNGFEKNQRLAEDTELCIRIHSQGYPIGFASDAVVIHDPGVRKFSQAVQYAIDHAAVTILLRNQYRSILKTPLVLRSPFLILLCSFFIALKPVIEIYIKNPVPTRWLVTAPYVYILKLAWCWGAARSLFKQRHRSGRAGRLLQFGR